MKTKPFSLRKFVLLWIIIYILVLVFGGILSIGITYSKNRNLLALAENDLTYYMENGEFNPQTIQNNANTFVYNRSGSMIDSTTSYRFPDDFDIDRYADVLFPKMKKRGTIYTIRFSCELPGHIAVAIAMPMENQGMFLFFKELPNLFLMLFVVFFSVTLLVVISALYMFLHVRNSMKLEKIQKEYVDNISHELKSPIASVRALTETMYDGLVREEQKRHQYYEIMLTELNGLEKTVSSMLELSKIQGGQIDCGKESVLTAEVFGKILDKYTALCESLGFVFRISPTFETGILLYTNKALAARMLDILLNNAVKFTGGRGEIQVFLTDESRYVTIGIKDNGTGIDPADQPHVFSRFYKGDKAHNEAGSGLGLAIAQQIALSLDEKLWLRNSSPEGTEFCFTVHKK